MLISRSPTISSRSLCSSQVHSFLECDWINTLKHSDQDVASLVLRTFKPSPLIQKIVDDVLIKLPADKDIVCVHHRNGMDWLKHCEKWGHIDDGVWRKNCMNEPGQTISSSIKKRLLQNPVPIEAEGSEETSPGVEWVNKALPAILYVGDNLPPKDLEEAGFEVFTRGWLLANEQQQADPEVMKNYAGDLDLDVLSFILSTRGISCPHDFRDICSIVDFHVCSTTSHFVGNSVSTWSALQIAERLNSATQTATWYNR